MKQTLSPVSLLGLFLVVTLVSWADEGGRMIPREPDYADSSQWFIKKRGGEVDLFYIVSTEIGDYTVGTDTFHHADTYDKTVCRNILKEMVAVDSFYSGNCNYFSPYYRQATMQSWVSEELALQRLDIPLADVNRSWDYYLRHLNQGRPFIIAGFSQGAHAMLNLMRQMPDSVLRRMVAAYCIGYRIPQELLDSCPQIRPAQGATDVGVTINFNSVRSADCAVPIVSGGNVVNINPVNWRTDTVAATFVCYGRTKNDTLTARCDPESHLVIVTGYETRFRAPVIGRDGNYHSMELKFYYPYIRKNMADRIQAFMQKD